MNRRHTELRVPVFVLSLLFAMAALGATASAAGVTTASVLKSARTSIGNQTSAHVVFTAKSGSTSATEKIVADVGTSGGVETVTNGSAELTIRVTSTHAYLKGNQSGLTTIYGLTSAQAKKVGKDWVSSKAGTSQYSGLKSDLTMTSVKSLLPKAKGTRLSTDSAGLYVLKWSTAATSSLPSLSNTLIVSTGTPTLPLTETSTAAGGTKATTKLSKWGEAIAVATPPLSSTIASTLVTG